MPNLTCGQCNAWYASERELRDHLQLAHRKVGETSSAYSAQAEIIDLNQREESEQSPA